MSLHSDVLVVGAGIIGTACAWTLQQEGYRVTLIDAASAGCGVTAAGMGHLVALDESEQELELCLYSLRLWREFLQAFPGTAEHHPCGTLWVAENEAQLAEAHQRAARLNAHDWQADAISGDQLARLEPALRKGLAGAVRVQEDSVIYPPAVAHFLSQQLVSGGGRYLSGRRVQSLAPDHVVLANGERIHAARIVVTTGGQLSELLPELRVFPRKGHLAITERYPGSLQHQVVSMDYGQSSMRPDGLTVAANVQPRPTGQWLIGSCRQDHQTDNALDPEALTAVLNAAMRLLPGLSEMRILRAWAGMRPATADGHPLIGVHPHHPSIWIAAGHEGLGVTTAWATAQIIADQMAGRTPAVHAAHYCPSRFIQPET
ncbi:NAD(P)/FAD-dependent oxidoreductase [Undibacterium curvum]|uniref:NAD(P)/FAD-dependent oxidoreductase n=1 Tax=Undibacterium curvum TaxID=2762294 RepID=UPI003D14456C